MYNCVICNRSLPINTFPNNTPRYCDSCKSKLMQMILEDNTFCMQRRSVEIEVRRAAFVQWEFPALQRVEQRGQCGVPGPDGTLICDGCGIRGWSEKLPTPSEPISVKVIIFIYSEINRQFCHKCYCLYFSKNLINFEPMGSNTLPSLHASRRSQGSRGSEETFPRFSSPFTPAEVPRHLPENSDYIISLICGHRFYKESLPKYWQGPPVKPMGSCPICSKRSVFTNLS